MYLCSSGQQNLVPNGSFEEYYNCPDNYDQINRVKYWYKPTLGTCDYFNACDVTGNFNVPSNILGYQYAQDGLGYAGIVAYSPKSNYQEYLQIKLITKLQLCKKYLISFHASLSDSSAYSVANLGLYFSSNALTDFTSADVLNEIPQVVESKDLYDKLNWFLIEKTYFANGSENYITIGNFDDSTKLIRNYVGQGYDLAYYYIDNVKIVEFSQSFPNVFTPNHDGINDTFYLSDDYDFEVYNRWGFKIFETNETTKFWNGELKNNESASDGTYYYLVYNCDRKIIHKSFLTLIK